ncbi:MAG: hypothetical protein AB9891_16055 [Anaerolineaceae bacterium]
MENPLLGIEILPGLAASIRTEAIQLQKEAEYESALLYLYNENRQYKRENLSFRPIKGKPGIVIWPGFQQLLFNPKIYPGEFFFQEKLEFNTNGFIQ